MKVVHGGIALLADYLIKKEDKESLTDYLENKVFHDAVGTGMDPVAEDVEDTRNLWKHMLRVLQSRKQRLKIYSYVCFWTVADEVEMIFSRGCTWYPISSHLSVVHPGFQH